jgi:ATP-dependent helicase/DNAse subunit B
LDDLTLQTDYGQRGTMVHEVLADLHRRLREAGVDPSAPPEVFARYLQDALEVLKSAPDDPALLGKALWAIDLRLVSRMTSRYRQQHGAYDERWAGHDRPLAPAHFEVSFGEESPSSDPLSRSEPLALPIEEGAVLIRGRIDRIDRGQCAGREVYSVIDYKSGKPPRRKNRSEVDGTRLQLDLYTIAVQDLLLSAESASPLAAGYWWLKEKGFKELLVCDGAEDGTALRQAWEERRREVLRAVGRLVAGVRQGQFPVYSLDPECTGHCPYSTICRVNHVRSLEKPWPPAAGAP